MMDRLSSARIATSASAFLDAGVVLAAAKKQHSLPVYFLFGQSIELSLKSFLRGKGYSKKRLRDISHDLALALTKASQEGIDEFLKISADDSELIASLGFHYRSKDLQYTEVGLKAPYPDIKDVESFAKKLLAAVRPFADQNLKAHYGKSTAVL
ncbi:hypothetical protein [Oleiharenicola lentus]|jgi:HEPN domain-containing protein|nr:hypothetical protein [Oleiharenicola lentus]